MRWHLALPLAAALCLAAPAARAQTVNDALKAVPKDSLAFVVINDPAQTSARVGTLAKHLGIPLPGDPLQLLKTKLGLGKSLNDKGTAMMAFLPEPGQPDDDPIPVAFLPVTDYKLFLQEANAKGDDTGIAEVQLGNPSVVAPKGKYAVVLQARHRKLMESVLEGENAEAPLLAATVAENDATAVLTPRGLKLIASRARKQLADAKNNLAGGPPELAQMAGAWIGAADSLMKSVESDVTSAAAGLKIDQAGNVHARAKVGFKRGSELARAAGGIEGLKGGPLAGLPAEPFAFAMGGAIPENAVKAMNDFTAEMFKAVLQNVNAPADTLKKLQEAYGETYKGMRGVGMMFAAGKADRGLMGSMIAVVHVDDAAEYLVRYEKATKAVNEAMQNLGLPGVPEYKLKKAKVAGRPAVELTMEIPGLDGAPEEAKKMMEAMFGATGKMTTTLAVADKNTILMRYTPAAGLEELVKSMKGKEGGPASLAEVAKTAALLPKGSQWAGYFSPSGLIDYYNRFVEVIPNANAPRLPAFPPSPPIGVGVRAGADGIEAGLVAPAATLRGLGKMIQNLKELGGAGVQ